MIKMADLIKQQGDLIRKESGMNIKEDHHDRNEGKMAKYDAKELADDAMDVFKMIEEGDDLPEWLELLI